jgi:hypothetical protein
MDFDKRPAFADGQYGGVFGNLTSFPVLHSPSERRNGKHSGSVFRRSRVEAPDGEGIVRGLTCFSSEQLGDFRDGT